MSTELKSSPEDRKRKFYSLKSFDDLAELLEVSSGHLNFVLYRLPVGRYTTFEIPKKSGRESRTIANPVPAIKNIQHRLLEVLESVYEPRCSSYGFIKNKSIVDNAKAHRKKSKLKYVLNVDLEDFFPSIHFGRVRGLFHKQPYKLPFKVANWLAQICCYEKGLPQGAPTSPIISNMICNKLDSQLQRLAEKNRCNYTRYADDITFSTTMPRFPSAIAGRVEGRVVLGAELNELLEENKFVINAEKTRLQEYSQLQEITGIIVNRSPNVQRKLIRQIRAMLHDWQTNKYDAAQKRHLEKYHMKYRSPLKPELSFRQIVRGKIEFLGMVRGKNDPVYRRYMLWLSRLDSRVKFEVKPDMVEKSAIIFLSYGRSDEEQVRDLYNRLFDAGYKPWMDKEDIVGGEDWDLAIERAIQSADLFISILSSHSVNKRGILQKEISKAFSKWEEKFPEDIFIIPLRLEVCDPPSRLRKFQWIDYFESNGWNKLTQAIQESLKRTALE